MTIATLALVVAIGLLGPLLATPRALRVPVVVGELLAGLAFGRTGLHRLDPADPTFAFLADVGFAMIMFLAGSHVPVRDRTLLSSIRSGLARAVAVGIVAVPLGYLVARLFHTGHGGVYAVLIASSSAALVLPIVDSLKLGGGPSVLQLLAQVAVADAVCIVAVPLVIDPPHAARAGVGALVLVAAAGLLYFVLSRAEAAGLRRRLHRVSERRGFALELRISLVLLLSLAALAQRVHVSVMLAGFSLGLVISALGEPKRLARQLFGLTEGLFGPLFFVWLGASLNLHDLAAHPSLIALGLVLSLAAIAAHLVVVVTGQPASLAGLAAAQLGVPIGAATLGTQLGVLHPGEAAAMLLGALVTLGGATVAARFVTNSVREGEALAS